MKYLKLIIVFTFFQFKLFSQQVTIEKFEDQKKNAFDDKTEITDKAVTSGFSVQVLDAIGIKEVKYKNAANAWISSVNPETLSGSKKYTIANPSIESDGKNLQIQLIKDGQTKTLTLNIIKSPQVTSSSTKKDKCVPIYSEKYSGDDSILNPNNNYGERPSSFNKKTIVYVYDFANGDTTKSNFYKIILKKHKLVTKSVVFNSEVLKPKEDVKFKIYNINRFVYNASIADTIVQFDSTPSALLSRFFIGDDSLLGGLMSTFSDQISLQANEGEESKALANDIQCFIEKYNWLQNRMLDIYSPTTKFPSTISIDYIDLAGSLADIHARTTGIGEQLQEKKTLVGECKTAEKAFKDQERLTIKLISDTTLLSTELINLQQKIVALNKSIKTLNGDQKKKKETELSSIKTALNAKQTDLKNKKTALNDAKNKLEELRQTQTISCPEDENKIEEALNNLTIINNLISILPSDADLKKTVVYVRNIVQQNNMYSRDYISLDGNLLELTMNISTKDSVTKYQPIPVYKMEPYKITIPVINKPFVSFSSGSFIASGKNLRNDTYTWQETVTNGIIDSANYTLVKSGYTPTPIGFSALANVEWRQTHFVGIGFSAGVGLTIEKSPRIAYLGGVSFFFGDLRQFTVTAGLTALQVDKLATNFQTVADNQTIYHSKPGLEYYKDFKVGNFVSLTFTPFRAYKPKKTVQTPAKEAP